MYVFSTYILLYILYSIYIYIIMHNTRSNSTAFPLVQKTASQPAASAEESAYSV